LKYDGTEELIRIDAHTLAPAEPVDAISYHFPIVLNDERGSMFLGGEYLPESIIGAYYRGIFPWPHEAGDRIWYSSDPRAILPLDGLDVSRRLARTLRQGKFHATVDLAFEQVIDGCADRLPDKTWITPELRDCYVELHHRGWAHSFEIWTADGQLAGGLYGLAVGGMFGAESMFHRVTDASKAAMVAMIQHLSRLGVSLIDLQVLTEHTERMGAIEIPREEYMQRLEVAFEQDISWLRG
jgi:leucyl/phenylalanyl-tRNA--protein transferase